MGRNKPTVDDVNDAENGMPLVSNESDINNANVGTADGNPSKKEVDDYSLPEISTGALRRVTVTDKKFGKRSLTFDFTDATEEQLRDLAVGHLRVRYKQGKIDDDTAEWPSELDEIIVVKDIEAKTRTSDPMRKADKLIDSLSPEQQLEVARRMAEKFGIILPS